MKPHLSAVLGKPQKSIFLVDCPLSFSPKIVGKKNPFPAILRRKKTLVDCALRKELFCGFP